MANLKSDIVNLFKRRFEDLCIQLIVDAYSDLRNCGRRINEEDENNITAQLIGFMKANPIRYSYHISIARENYLDGEKTYKGQQDADKSPRIDIRYVTWNSAFEYEYFMEAKNLAEGNWRKSTNVLVDALGLQKRYIETGIKNFTSGYYSNGCLLGYVLQGTHPRIIQKLNYLLNKNGMAGETLMKGELPGCDFYYTSNHSNTAIPLLKHFLLEFN